MSCLLSAKKPGRPRALAFAEPAQAPLFGIRALLRGGTQCELLHAPVQQLADIERVLVRASDLVNPAEFALDPAAAANHAQHLSIKRQLVDTAREGIGAVKHLIGARRD